MRLVQFLDENGSRRVGLADAKGLRQLADCDSVYALGMQAAREGTTIAALVETRVTDVFVDYDALEAEGRLLPPLDHPDDDAHCFVTGTGLTHLGSADARDKMHTKLATADDLTDSMKMFRMGLESGKPEDGTVGVQPEWFYKGDGSCVAAPGAALAMPSFALDGGEEPEVAGLYIIGEDGAPYRLGFALGNEFSDHILERQNYLYLAHSKLRACALGPEMLLGALPQNVQGSSRIRRGDELVWEHAFLSGESNMSHSIANLEHHHFKYAMFRRPGDVHIHFFGTATLSFSDGISVGPGDVFEIEAEAFGRPLRNTLSKHAPEPVRVKAL
ncbi:MAG: AraD1 family protein [Alphaproteobacteria bacterium]